MKPNLDITRQNHGKKTKADSTRKKPLSGGETVTTTKSDKDAADFYDAKATLYRDLATVFAIVFGFQTVALSVGSANTNPTSLDSIIHQHPYIFPATVALGVLLLLFGWKMVTYDRKVVEAKRSTMRK